MDKDTEKSLERRADYLIRGGADVIQATFLTPLPDSIGRLVLYQAFWDAAGNFLQRVPILGRGIGMIKRLA